MHRHWRSVVGLVADVLTDQDSPLTSPLLAEEMARTAAVAALHTFPNTAMTRQHVPGAGRIASAAVRRAMAHIEANADRPVPLAEIADVAGTDTVAGVAARWGFGDVHRFTTRYLATHGAHPADTLRT